VNFSSEGRSASGIRSRKEPTMKTITILLVAMLALAGSAYADTSATTAAQGTYPSGTSFNGVNLSGLQIATAAFLVSDGTAEGHIAIGLKGTTALGTQQTISIEAEASSGSNAAANSATINGTCTIDMGDGTPALTGVPIVATITTNDQNQGTVGLVIGATALPAATVTGGSMTIASVAQ
jgi:hypothetical protein